MKAQVTHSISQPTHCVIVMLVVVSDVCRSIIQPTHCVRVMLVVVSDMCVALFYNLLIV